jgi:dihydroorotase
MWLLLKGGRVIDPANGVDEVMDVLIRDGAVSYQLSAISSEDYDVVDCSGLVVAPGLIDMHVHLREPGGEHKETIESGAAAAAAGGFTTIVAMPNTSPAPDNRAVVEFILNRGKATGINVIPCAAMTKGMGGTDMAELGDMADAGACAISDDAFPIQNSLIMRRVMEYAAMLGLPALVHCEDKTLVADGVMNEGICSTVLGLRGMPAAAEVSMVERNILLGELTGCHVHIQHVSSAGSVEAVRRAKARGLKVTAETCPQYWTLTEEALGDYSTNLKMNPPLRTKADIEAVRAGLADGTIDVIATDHAPHSLEDKEVEFPAASFGIVGLETSLALGITKLVGEGVLTLPELVEKMAAAPARALGLDRGTLSEGAAADVVVFDPEAEWVVSSSEFKSKGRNTPFEGSELKGKVVATIAGGRIAFGEFRVQSSECRVGVN